jgi:hypothetical protein
MYVNSTAIKRMLVMIIAGLFCTRVENNKILPTRTEKELLTQAVDKVGKRLPQTADHLDD